MKKVTYLLIFSSLLFSCKKSEGNLNFDDSQSIEQKQKELSKYPTTVTFNKVNSIDVVFDNQLSTNKYSINLSCNKNINVWYSNKTEKGFTINSELAFQGYVDWTILNIT